MLRTALVGLLFVATFGKTAFTVDRALIAEGDYAFQKTDETKVVAHWKLWQTERGAYEVVESSTRSPGITQIFRFDARFMPSGYALTLGPLSEAQLDRNPAAKTFYHPMSVSCDYLPQKLTCKTEYGGQSSVSAIDTNAPYVFLPGEFYSLDFTWFLTGVVHLIEHQSTRNSAVNVYVMADNGSNHSITFKADKPIKMNFTGEETAVLMGKTQEVRRYEQSGTAALSLINVTEKGLVGLISEKDRPTTGITIANYIEYVPWESPFRPVLRVGSIPEAPAENVAATATQVQPVQVSKGVMQGLALHKVPPVYPEIARQSHVEGTVLLSALIGKDGHVIELKPISGPAELISASIVAVKQWEYSPYMSSGQPVEVQTEIQVNFTLSH
jgi:TonB-like protein